MLEARGTVMKNEKRNGALHRFTLKTIKPMPEIRIAGRLRDWGSGMRDQGFGVRIQGSDFMVHGLVLQATTNKTQVVKLRYFCYPMNTN